MIIAFGFLWAVFSFLIVWLFIAAWRFIAAWNGCGVASVAVTQKTPFAGFCVMCLGKVTAKSQSKLWKGPCHEWCDTYY